MANSKPHVGGTFPRMTVPRLGGGDLVLGAPDSKGSWQMIVVYRGKHCPICTRYLSDLNEVMPDLKRIDIDVVAVSADPEARAKAQTEEAGAAYPVGHSLSVAQMKALGLYISDPRSASETDRPFAEPGLFVVNANGDLQVVDISNAPFARPSLTSMVQGLKFIKDPSNSYPIRGTYDDRN